MSFRSVGLTAGAVSAVDLSEYERAANTFESDALDDEDITDMDESALVRVCVCVCGGGWR